MLDFEEEVEMEECSFFFGVFVLDLELKLEMELDVESFPLLFVSFFVMFKRI